MLIRFYLMFCSKEEFIGVLIVNLKGLLFDYLFIYPTQNQPKLYYHKLYFSSTNSIATSIVFKVTLLISHSFVIINGSFINKIQPNHLFISLTIFDSSPMSDQGIFIKI